MPNSRFASVRRNQGWPLIAEYSNTTNGGDYRRSGFSGSDGALSAIGAVLIAGRLDRMTRHARGPIGRKERPARESVRSRKQASHRAAPLTY
jgi:hypothetical protein